MKKSVLFMLISLFAIQLASAKEVITRDVEKLPQDAKTFITKHFPGEKISYLKIDKEFLSTTYDVTFVSGIEIEFMSDGQWKDVDCKRGRVPDAIIPERILQYVKTNFGESFITQIEKNRRSYEVELSNGLDLHFDVNGNVIRIDD